MVDAERGLILTNRHVVTPGPVTAKATFLNREEVQLYPIYRDPVHDFGFYRYDPSKLRFIRPKALPLYPEGAQIGREIRVVGNNAGEQLSILAGTLARLDRDAPEYGVAKYNDFNTFYLQAASGTSGGSSGSPVIDIRGRVVGLNAGGASGAASSFYLPLGRVRRALGLIQQGKPVHARHALHRLQLRAVRRARAPGLDAAHRSGGAHRLPALHRHARRQRGAAGLGELGVLQPGDVLVRVNGRYVTQFEPLEELLDASVGSRSKSSSSAAASRCRRSCRSAICTPSRRAPSSSSARRSSTRSPISRRGTSTCRSAACTSPTPATCSARRPSRAAP